MERKRRNKGGKEIKYIEAEKLIAEIERRKNENREFAQKRGYSCLGNSARIKAIEDEAILSIITSLQQEQPEVDLKEEFHRWLSKEKEEWGGEIPPYGEYGLFSIARHFYELGFKAGKK